MTETAAIQKINSNNQCSFIALIDAKFNNRGQIMSLGLLIVRSSDFHILNFNYYIISPEYKVGGTYSYALNLPGINNLHYSKEYVLKDINEVLLRYHVQNIYGYNISNTLLSIPELEDFNFYDISIIATSSHYNKFIDPRSCDENGLLKGPKDLNAMLVIVDDDYSVTHNALMDCVTILQLMESLDLPVHTYNNAKVKNVASLVPHMSKDSEDLILPEVDYVTPAQAAHILGINEYQVINLIRSKKIKSHTVHKQYRIYKDDLYNYIKQLRQHRNFASHIVFYILFIILVIISVIAFIYY